MYRNLSTVLAAALFCVGLTSAIPSRADEPDLAQKKERIVFPYLLPGSRTVIGGGFVDEVNALATRDEQIQFLIKTLPPTDQKEKRLSDRQLFAIRLLSLTDSDVVIEPLVERFDFAHKSDGWPAVHALGRLGERSVEPVVKKLASVTKDRQSVATLGAALIEIKEKQFPKFISELKGRKDVQLPDEVLQEMLEQYQFAPDK
jgi:hypothetical protein